MSNKQKPRPSSSLPPPKAAPTIEVGRPKKPPTLLIIGAVVAAVLVLGIIVAVVAGGGDDNKAQPPEFYARTVEATGGALVPLDEALAEQVAQGVADDPAVGEVAPILSGQNYANEPVKIDAAANGPTLVVVLAHWCPHCNAEIPVLNEWRDSGRVPDGLNVVGVSTAIDNTRPNYPPDTWLEDKGWEWPVLADSVDATASRSLAVTGFPTLVFIGSDGTVKWRTSGELPIDELEHLVAVGMADES